MSSPSFLIHFVVLHVEILFYISLHVDFGFERFFFFSNEIDYDDYGGLLELDFLT